jgi:hypothetical protein
MRWAAIALAAVAAAVVVPPAAASGVPVQITPVADRLWAASDYGLQVVDTKTGAVVRTPATTYPYATLAARLGRTIWVASITNGYLAGAIDPFDALTAAHLGRPIHDRSAAVYDLAAAKGTLWAWFGSPASARSTLVRVRVVDRKRRRFAIDAHPGWMVATPAGLWFDDGETLRTLGRFAGSARAIVDAPVPDAPLAFGAGGVWLLSGRTATRFDIATRRPTTVVRAAQPISLLVASQRALWLVTWTGTRARLLALTPGGTVTESRPLSFLPSDMRLVARHLWLGRSAPSPAVIELDARTLRQERSISLG